MDFQSVLPLEIRKRLPITVQHRLEAHAATTQTNSSGSVITIDSENRSPKVGGTKPYWQQRSRRPGINALRERSTAGVEIERISSC